MLVFVRQCQGQISVFIRNIPLNKVNLFWAGNLKQITIEFSGPWYLIHNYQELWLPGVFDNLLHVYFVRVINATTHFWINLRYQRELYRFLHWKSVPTGKRMYIYMLWLDKVLLNISFKTIYTSLFVHIFAKICCIMMFNLTHNLNDSKRLHLNSIWVVLILISMKLCMKLSSFRANLFLLKKITINSYFL